MSTVPCPAYGTYVDRQGVRRCYKDSPRQYCLLRMYEHCDTCPNKRFTLTLLRADSTVVCPVLETAKSGATWPDSVYMRADLIAIQRSGKAVVEDVVSINSCVYEQPFNSCVGCRERKRWTKN